MEYFINRDMNQLIQVKRKVKSRIIVERKKKKKEFTASYAVRNSEDELFGTESNMSADVVAGRMYT